MTGGAGFNPQPCIGYAADPKVKFPRMETWNLNIQHAFTNNMSLDLGYIGSHTQDITGIADEKRTRPGYLRQQRSGWQPAPSSRQRNDRTTPSFPGFPLIQDTVDMGSANYAALQAALNQRVSHGLSYSVDYTFSHAVGEQGGVGTGNGLVLNTACPRCEYGNLTFDVTSHSLLA